MCRPSMQPTSLPVITLLFSLVSFYTISFPGILLHFSQADFVVQNVQEWQNKEDDLLIQFAYVPQMPIIDTFTELKFNIQTLSTGEHVENLTARVVVTNGQRLFKFENISIPAGHFSVKYIFPDDGTHQVLLRLDKDNDLKIPASFNVFVPHQSPPSILDPFPSSPGRSNDDLGVLISKILAILLPATAIATLVIMLKKMSKR